MNRPRRRLWNILSTICAAAFICAAANAAAQTGSSPMSSRRAAMIDASEATRRLGQARLEREQGMTPLPGERIRGMDASALNHRYWRRQEKLRLAVEQAQRRSNETQPANGMRQALLAGR
jgi:hypothetical protein